ncbi:MAG: hypothetical protein AAF547_04100 [Actinomycetota bacterium]
MLTDGPPAAAGSNSSSGRLARALDIRWLGQTVASLAWISSVLVAGIGSGADWLQLLAASAWLAANVASLVSTDG